MKRYLLLLFLWLLSGTVPVLAQERADYEEYVRLAGMNMPVFRARLATTYAFPYNGTYKLDTLGFRTGSLVFGGKRYDHLLMDVDARQQHLLVRYPQSPVILDIGQDRVERFDLAGVPYINLRAAGYDVPEGFYQEVAKGRGTVYRMVRKYLWNNATGDKWAEIGYDDPHYRTDVFSFFGIRETWFLVREDGTVFPLKRKQDLLKAFPNERKAVRRYLNQTGLFDAGREQWTRAAMIYIEDLSHEKE